MAEALIYERFIETADPVAAPAVLAIGSTYRVAHTQSELPADGDEPRRIHHQYFLERRRKRDRLGERGWRDANTHADFGEDVREALADFIAAGLLG